MIFKIILVILIAALLYVGYMIFASVFIYSDKGKAYEPDPEFIDSDKDMMRPTAKRYYDFRRPRMEAFKKLPFEELTVTSFDGLKLYGYLLRGNPKEVVICVHGYKSSMEEDFSDRIEIYQKRGSTILLVNDRGHGKSEGKYLGFSEHDKRDVAKWVDKMNEMFDEPEIYLHGVSMGGATVIHCADMKLKNVKGIVDDCGFISILKISQYLISDLFHMPYFPCGYIAWMWALLLAKTSFNASDGEKCVQNTDIPIVFIHGLEDHYVPCEMSKKMYEKCVSLKELHLIEGCGHAAAYMMATEEYTEAVNRLLDHKIV